jgi:2-dehydro-3-deoxyphosphogluconate aldolase/(4S)-4-hydroxy-2-oxoglutarate aldolase
MITKQQSLQTIRDTGAVLIVRLDSAKVALEVSKAAIDGGIRALEITLSVPGALGVIETLAAEYRDQGILIGAGTVLDGQSAFSAIQAGSQLLVSPQLNPDMIAVANRYQAVSMSGAFTPTEIVNTVQCGADIVKLFPAEFLGPRYVKTIMAPLAHIPIAPTGGVTPENVGEWFDAGVTAVGVGSFITKAAGTGTDYQLVSQAAKTFLAAIDQARYPSTQAAN